MNTSVIDEAFKTLDFCKTSMHHGIEWLFAVNSGSFRKDFRFWKRISDTEKELSIEERGDIDILEELLQSTTYDFYGYHVRLNLARTLESHQQHFSLHEDRDFWYHLLGKGKSEAKRDLKKAITAMEHSRKKRYSLALPPDWHTWSAFCKHIECPLSQKCMFLFAEDMLGIYLMAYENKAFDIGTTLNDLEANARPFLSDVIRGEYYEKGPEAGWPIKYKESREAIEIDSLVSAKIAGYLAASLRRQDELADWTRNEGILQKILGLLRTRMREGVVVGEPDELSDGLWESVHIVPPENKFQRDLSLSVTLEIASDIMRILRSKEARKQISKETKKSAEEMLSAVCSYCQEKIRRSAFVTYCFERERYFLFSPVSDIKGAMKTLGFWIDLYKLQRNVGGKFMSPEFYPYNWTAFRDTLDWLIHQQSLAGYWPILSEDGFQKKVVRKELDGELYTVAKRPNTTNISFDNTLDCLSLLCRYGSALYEVKYCEKCGARYPWYASYCGKDGTPLKEA